MAPFYSLVDMRVASFNVNGIRAAERRGFAAWLADRAPDVVGLQEVRCGIEHLPAGVFGPYHATVDVGTIPGRNGVALLTRQAPAAVRAWGTTTWVIPPAGEPIVAQASPTRADPLARELRAFAAEGRYVEIDLADAPVTVASLYLPKGGTLTEDDASARRYERKMRFLAGFARHVGRERRAAAALGREFLVMGDFNIAHTPLDVKNWRANQKNEGFLPEERAWLDELIGPRTLVDVVRELHPGVDGPYSWWSWRGQAFDRDSGWRIDYQLASPRLARTALDGGTDRAPSYDSRISDHAPVVVDYDVDWTLGTDQLD